MIAGGDTVPWSSFLTEAVERLTAAGIDSPEVDARRIVEQAAGVESADFHTALREPATVMGVARFDSMLGRRAAGEPLQYVLGHWGFRYLDLLVDPRVLVPRPETEVVAGLAIAEVIERSDNGRSSVMVADMGTGSGAIGLSVASECASSRVFLTDASADALEVATANLAGMGRAATRVSIHHGSWFEAIPRAVRGSLDVIVSNPPYVADHEVLPAVVSEWEPEDALRAGPDGTDDLLHLVRHSPQWLAADGTLVLEMAPLQTSLIAAECASLGFDAEVHLDLAGRERAVVARRRG